MCDADHRGIIIEQEFGERLGQFGLADARRAQEQERTDRTVGILQPRASTANRVGHGTDRFLLTDHAPAETLLHVQEFLAFAFEHLVDRNPGPARNHLRNVFLGHDLVDES
jgi:hypothetical protein